MINSNPSFPTTTTLHGIKIRTPEDCNTKKAVRRAKKLFKSLPDDAISAIQSSKLDVIVDDNDGTDAGRLFNINGHTAMVLDLRILRPIVLGLSFTFDTTITVAILTLVEGAKVRFKYNRLHPVNYCDLSEEDKRQVYTPAAVYLKEKGKIKNVDEYIDGCITEGKYYTYAPIQMPEIRKRLFRFNKPDIGRTAMQS